MCLFFPQWGLQCVWREQAETRVKAAALFERNAHGSVVAVCSAEAGKLGVRGGMSVADARALAPGLLLVEADYAAYQTRLEEVCAWAIQFSPLVGVEPAGPHAPHAEAIFLDTTGCEQVFRGEENLLRLALEGVRKLGLFARAAYAETLGAAWARARFGSGVRDQESGVRGQESEISALDFLNELPLAALRLDHDTLACLHALGLQRVGELMRQPRAALPSRLGPLPLLRLDQALGTAPETLTLLRPAPEFRVGGSFEYPVRNTEMLFPIIERMMEKLADELDAAGRGARVVECWLFHEVASPARVECLLHRSSASGAHLWQLLRTRLEAELRSGGTLAAERSASILGGRSAAAPKVRNTFAMEIDDRVLEVEEGVCAVAVQVLSSERLSERQLALFERATDEPGRLGLLWDRLASRLGQGAVMKARLEEHTLPECEVLWEQINSKCKMQNAKLDAAEIAERPLRLFKETVAITVDWPRRFLWNGREMRIAAFTGPERIETAWWTQKDQRRDYYIIETETGGRYWVFRRIGDEGWFLHGVFE
ncbi:MAG TPA: DNA polymerase Y family protein [Planctomycetota bacterium]|nr:DNA polymerase Y family protein [Planctomycetota bacterium]